MKITIALYFTLIISIFVSIDSSKNQKRIRTSSKTKDCPCDAFIEAIWDIQSQISSINDQIDQARSARFAKGADLKTIAKQVAQLEAEKVLLVQAKHVEEGKKNNCYENPRKKADCERHHGISV